MTISPDNLHFASVLHRKNDGNGRVYIDFFFVAKQWEGVPKIAEPDKCDKVAFMQLNDLPDNIVFFVKDAITNLSNPTYYFESGWTALSEFLVEQEKKL